MAQADNIYRKFFEKNFPPYDANFPPDAPISLGSFGKIKDGSFKMYGDIKKDYNIDYDIHFDDTPAEQIFKKVGNVGLNEFAKGDIGSDGIKLAKAQVELDFTSEKSLFISSNDIKHNKITNLKFIGDRIVELIKNNKWERDYVVITEVVEAGNTVIMTGSSKSAKVIIKAKTDTIESINLLNLNNDLEFSVNGKLDLNIKTEKCQLGFVFSRIRRRNIIGRRVLKLKPDIINNEEQMDNESYYLSKSRLKTYMKQIEEEKLIEV